MENICINFYEQNIRKLMPLEYTNKDHEICIKIFKSITHNIWSDKIMNDEQKLEYFDEYNKDNIREMLMDSVQCLKTLNTTESISMRDLTLLPTSWLFYNQEIKVNDGVNDIVKTFETSKIFSTGKLEIGFQNGRIKECGEVEIDSMKNPIFEEDKCYVMLSFVKSNNLTTNEKKEDIFIDYFLGNISFE